MSCSPGRNEGKGMPGRGTGGAKAGSQEGESSREALTAEERARGGGRGAEGKKARLEREVGPGLPEASGMGVLGGYAGGWTPGEVFSFFSDFPSNARSWWEGWRRQGINKRRR